MTYKVLVLGATGFIGGHIARAAVERGWTVRGLRRRPGAVGHIGDLAVEWAEGNLDDLSSLQAAMRDCRVVFHCAGAYPHRPKRLAHDVAAAVAQMRRVLAAARDARVERVVYTSSFTTIGPPAEPGRLADERDFYTPGTTGDPYYEAKWAMEVEALAAYGATVPSASATGHNAAEAPADRPDVVVLCPTAVFGPGDVHLSVSRPLLLAARGRLPVYVDAAIGVIDVRDAAQAHLAAAERGQAGQRYIVNGHNLSLGQVLAETARLAGVRPPRIRLGSGTVRVLAAVGSLLPGIGGEASYLRTMPLWQPLSNARAQAELGLCPRPWQQTLADALAWFREHGFL